MEKSIEKLFGLISSAKRIVAIGHHNPDGDSVGSLTAMHAFLSQCSKESQMILPSSYPSFLSHLDPNHNIVIYTKEPDKVEGIIAGSDLMICLDFNRMDRTDKMQHCLIEFKGPKVLIDHHPGPEKENFDLVFSDTSMSSACELLFWILMKMPQIGGDVSKMDFRCAESLCTGMLTDTNNFNNSVIPSTFKMASLLMERGVNFQYLHKEVFASFSSDRMRLMGYMLNEALVIDEETHSAYMILTREIQKKYHYDTGDSEGFVNLGLEIKGIEVSALFTENDENIRVSLRSSGSLSVNQLSNRFFNGGGHEKAAGGTLFIPVHEVPEYFINAITTFIRTEA